MPLLSSRPDRARLEADVRARRLWYHDIELFDGVRTRFPEDYEANPVLRGVDRGNDEIEKWMDRHVPIDLSGRCVLDLGCADGRFTFRAVRAGARRVIGVERNRCNFARAVWLRDLLDFGDDRVELHHCGIERFSCEESFDLVYCVGLIYHLISPLATLARIRRWCSDLLLFSSAVDLANGDGSPLARLDRYATGAHGLWSFNTSMLRQLLTTAGFEIVQEQTTGSDGPGAYFALARPGHFQEHHVFAETIDEEFPIDLQRRRRIVRAAWRRLAGQIDKPIALFGAGTHTPWLLDQVRDLAGVTVTCVLDDRIPPTATVAGLPVRAPAKVDPTSWGAVVLSSWHQTKGLEERAHELFEDQVRIVSLD